METLIKILLALLFISILIFLCSRNKSQWRAQNHYPSGYCKALVYDYSKGSYQTAEYFGNNVWHFEEYKPKHFKWRKLND